MIKTDLKYCIAILVAMLAVISISPEWTDWLMKGTRGNILLALYGYLGKFKLLNWIVAASVVAVLGWWGYRIAKDDDIRWYRLLIILLAMELVHFKNELQAAAIAGGFTYRGLLTVAAISLVAVFAVKAIIVSVHRYKKRKEIEKEGDEKPLGFSDDNIQSEKTPQSLQLYADSIVELLMNTNLKEHAFALGITGEWGSGKSTFLELLENRLTDKTEVVKFNPWMCRTPEQVTEDFFTALQEGLSGKHSSLRKPIRDYAKYISNATLSWGHGFLSKLTLVLPQESLQEKKQRLSERFARLDKPVVVMIDDLDRLERNEVFEVLRLIRNTADLRNVIYIVAYDKEYVTHVLDSSNIKDANGYLEKIFPAEIHQPKVEGYQIEQLIYSELSKIKLFNGDFAKLLLSRLTPKDKDLIVKTVGTYRQAKRLIRTYTLNVTYIQKVFPNEISLTDLFWMELLQQYDKRVYDLLDKEPQTLLYGQLGRYYLRAGIDGVKAYTKTDKMWEYKGDVVWKDHTPQVLEILFGKYREAKPASICNTENFGKFFTLGVSPKKLSLREFKAFLGKPDEEEATIRKWLKDGKYYTSVTYQFEYWKVKQLSEQQLEAYLRGALFMGKVMGEHKLDYGRTLRSLLEADRFTSEQEKVGADVVSKWFDEQIQKGESLAVISKLLQRLYQSTLYNEERTAEPDTETLIANKTIEAMLAQVMERYLALHPETSAMDLYKEKSEVGQVFGNCSVPTVDGQAYQEFNQWKNVAYDAVIKHCGKQTKPLKKDMQMARSDMFCENLPAWSDDPDVQDAYERAEEDRQEKLAGYFGSDSKVYEEFVNACFAEDAAVATKVAVAEKLEATEKKGKKKSSK